MEERQIWKVITNEKGATLYEGFTLYGKPYGAGTLYFENGSIFKEGVFGIKGLLCGREYYPSGKLRFEGLYELCKGYGLITQNMGNVTIRKETSIFTVN